MRSTEGMRLPSTWVRWLPRSIVSKTPSDISRPRFGRCRAPTRWPRRARCSAHCTFRAGRTSDALGVFEAMLSSDPQRSDIRNAAVLLTAWSRSPNQRLQGNRPASFACSVGARGVHLPASINGRAVNWLLDTGFTTTGLSESEARWLGLAVHSASARANDGAGGSTTARTTVAERLLIGGTEIRNVPMLVFPDSQPPWNDLEQGARGIIGLPVAVALGTIHWTSSGTCRTGPGDVGRAGDAGNLVFDGTTPLTRVSVAGRPLEFALDTGNVAGSQLWERFGLEFPMLVADGTKGLVRLNQIGGSTEREVVVLPRVQLRVGGFDTLLEPANVFSRPVGDDRLYGNLGTDLLSQAAAVTIDFERMALTLQ